jgi:RimJ/RimL family protein N-acetyltransferase
MVVMPDLVAPVVPAGRLRDQSQPELFVDELTLRPWRSADAPAVVRAYQDPAIQQWHVRTMSDHEAEQWVATWPERWAAETGAGWAVCDDRRLLARMSLRTLNLAEGLGEVAYWVLPEARGRGVAPRALQAMSTWLFVDVGLHRIELAHSTANTGSCRVATKAGYMLKGTKRQQALHRDGWHDMHLHARLQGDTDDSAPGGPNDDRCVGQPPPRAARSVAAGRRRRMRT